MVRPKANIAPLEKEHFMNKSPWGELGCDKERPAFRRT
jgi:hypothetical protein